MALDPRIEVIREKYGLSREDFWELPQKKGTWLVKHAALETAAAKARIVFDAPQIIEANTADGIAVMSVRGMMGEQIEWATGEASPKNNKNAYPWAMAEKRSKDRVILKLIGIHGLVYSEDEFDEPPPAPKFAEQPEPMSNTAAKEHWKTISEAMFKATTLKQLQGVWQRHYPVYQTLPESLQAELRQWKDDLKDKLMAFQAALEAPQVGSVIPPNFDNLEKTQ